MRIYRSLAEVPEGFGPSALTIGNFDGVHIGHRKILRRLVEVARRNGWKPSVLTFDPHPTRVVAPERTPPLLTTPAHRAALMAEEGVEQVLILPFDGAVARLSPEEFVREIVCGRLSARAALVGANFRFGHKHAGDYHTLEELGRRFGCQTETVGSVFCRGRMVSSSAVRELLAAGRVATAVRFLGRPYGLEGEVEAGRGVGSKQTVPTLNLATEAEVIPANGVYVTRTRDLDDGRAWNSVTNVGYRPTFGDSDGLSVETFLLDPLDGASPRRISVAFLERLREERKFEDPEVLKSRIFFDVGVAQRYFRRRGALP
ncbi:MAG TPA: bifunctional riboflavin kinase/FAD synthetase [Bryobacteraceae bacterium]|nr:bifunctional riboflavin kinase/FAD synthetase [Bryobacteraceae bacterium]